MPSRDHLPHRANRRWAALLVLVLSACGLETKQEPNLRVVGPPALVRPASAGPATSTAVKTEIGDAVIISTRPTPKQLAPDPDAEAVGSAPVNNRPVATTEDTEPETTTTVAPTTTEITTITTIKIGRAHV